MNKEVKEKWIAALRSGSYKQGQFSLETEEGEMCCLGVLCHVMFGNAREKQDESGVELLSAEFLNSIGLTEISQGFLSSMNDATGRFHRQTPKSFSEIADYIEENL